MSIKKIFVSDHRGNVYFDTESMCKAYGVDYWLFKKRIGNGMDVEKALTYKPVGCEDHTGRHFDSKSARARYWDLNPRTVRNRLEYGWTLEDALTTPASFHGYGRPRPCTDHLGRTYPSKTARAEAYGLHCSIVDRRLREGMSLESALTTPIAVAEPYEVDGTVYSSFAAACHAYGIGPDTVKTRLDNHWDIKTALETPVSIGVGMKLALSRQDVYLKDGSTACVMKYKSSKDIDVLYSDGHVEKGVRIDNFLKKVSPEEIAKIKPLISKGSISKPD